MSKHKGMTRRDVLKVAPLVFAAGAAFTALMAKPLVSKLGRLRGAPEFPEGSIFTPADKRSKL